jgi:hypothetical protein
VTSQGSPYGRFRRALDNQNAMAALSAAAELPTVGLVDALELVLLLRDKAPEKYGRAALRWHGRYCGEVKDVGLEGGPGGPCGPCSACRRAWILGGESVG